MELIGSILPQLRPYVRHSMSMNLIFYTSIPGACNSETAHFVSSLFVQNALEQ